MKLVFDLATSNSSIFEEPLNELDEVADHEEPALVDFQSLSNPA